MLANAEEEPHLVSQKRWIKREKKILIVEKKRWLGGQKKSPTAPFNFKLISFARYEETWELDTDDGST